MNNKSVGIIMVLIGIIILQVGITSTQAYTSLDLSNVLNSSNITIYDGYSNTQYAWYGRQEQDEVEPETAMSNLFNLEAIFLTSRIGIPLPQFQTWWGMDRCIVYFP